MYWLRIPAAAAVSAVPKIVWSKVFDSHRAGGHEISDGCRYHDQKIHSRLGQLVIIRQPTGRGRCGDGKGPELSDIGGDGRHEESVVSW